MTNPVENWELTAHAVEELTRRNIDVDAVISVLARPGQRFAVRPGRDVLQSIVEMAGRRYVIRVFVDVDRSPAEVVTVYRSSKIEKYWKGAP